MSEKKPTLAEILYNAYRRAARSENPTWLECTDEERKQWEEVANAAQDWAYENIQWQE